MSYWEPVEGPRTNKSSVNLNEDNLARMRNAFDEEDGKPYTGEECKLCNNERVPEVGGGKALLLVLCIIYISYVYNILLYLYNLFSNLLNLREPYIYL